MEFRELLNQYIEQLQCSAKDLADATGLSQAVISRYRAGTRVPSADSEQMKKLAQGICELSKFDGWTKEGILQHFTATLSNKSDDVSEVLERFNIMLLELKVNISDFAHALNYDASYISRIRSGQRTPANISDFAEHVSQYVAKKYNRLEDLEEVARLIGSDVSLLTSEEECTLQILHWLLGQADMQGDFVGKFLIQLDEFNLDDYIKAIHFDELKVPNIPFQLGATFKKYFGLEEIKQANLDFLKTTVLSKSMEPLFMYDDTPMADLARETDFPKKWMFGLAMALKKGLHINIIHNLNRPFEEMMLGLEAWVPLYMTGQVSPYYFPGVQNQVFNHFLNVSGVAALEGECITGFHEDVRYYLTRNKGEVAHYRNRAEHMIACASPLMDIYRKEDKDAFYIFKEHMATEQGTRQERMASLPIYSMPEELLLRIAKRYELSEKDYRCLEEYRKTSLAQVEQFMEHDAIYAEIPVMTKEEISKYPMPVSLSGAFYDGDLNYTYEEYKEHLDATESFAKEHENYHMERVEDTPFRNIQIIIREGEWAMISKNRYPTIHFVIRHPKLLHAIENMVTPIVE